MKFTACIVDDEAHIRKMIRSVGLWTQHGIEVIGEAVDGIQALQMIRENRPDILLLDMRMPGIDGIQLLHEMNIIGMKPIVIVISGFDDFAFAHQAIKFGVLDYILKPIQRDELNESLKRAADRLEVERERKKVGGFPDLSQTPSGAEPDAASQAYDYIVHHYTEEISLNSLAAQLYLSKEFLSRSFKKKYDIGVTAFIHQNRLNKAKEFLQQGYKINYISDAVGFKDVNYFSKQFKKAFHITPSEYSDKFRHTPMH